MIGETWDSFVLPGNYFECEWSNENRSEFMLDWSSKFCEARGDDSICPAYHWNSVVPKSEYPYET